MWDQCGWERAEDEGFKETLLKLVLTVRKQKDLRNRSLLHNANKETDFCEFLKEGTICLIMFDDR